MKLISVHLMFLVHLVQCDNSSMVMFSSNKEIKSFYVPISNYPIQSWMDVQEGIYPNVTSVISEVQIGTPLSIMIYYIDKSKLYHVTVKTCFAYDEEKFEDAHNIFMLYNDKDVEETYGRISYWNEIKNIEKFTTLLYSNFTAFKFPEKHRIYLTCNVEICYGTCRVEKDNLNKI